MPCGMTLWSSTRRGVPRPHCTFCDKKVGIGSICCEIGPKEGETRVNEGDTNKTAGQRPFPPPPLGKKWRGKMAVSSPKAVLMPTYKVSFGFSPSSKSPFSQVAHVAERQDPQTLPFAAMLSLCF